MRKGLFRDAGVNSAVPLFSGNINWATELHADGRNESGETLGLVQK
jgi:hypothetical protein